MPRAEKEGTMTRNKVRLERVTLRGCYMKRSSGEVWPTAECGKRTILGNDSEDRDTIIVQLEPPGPGGFHDETRWMDPNTWLVRGVVRRADDRGAEPAQS